jgi:hypothetical protein
MYINQIPTYIQSSMDDPAFSAALSKLTRTIRRTQVKKRKKNNNNNKSKQNIPPSSFDLVSMNDTVEVYIYIYPLNDQGYHLAVLSETENNLVPGRLNDIYTYAFLYLTNTKRFCSYLSFSAQDISDNGISNRSLPDEIWDEWLWKCDPNDPPNSVCLMNKCQMIGLLICRYRATRFPPHTQSIHLTPSRYLSLSLSLSFSLSF